MLILTRRQGQTVTVGNDVTITVLRIRGNQVQLGIAAPAEVSVHREEIFDRIHGGEQPDSEALASSDGP